MKYALLVILFLAGCVTQPQRCEVKAEQVNYQGEDGDGNTIQIRMYLEKCTKAV